MPTRPSIHAIAMLQTSFWTCTKRQPLVRNTWENASRSSENPKLLARTRGAGNRNRLHEMHAKTCTVQQKLCIDSTKCEAFARNTAEHRRRSREKKPCTQRTSASGTRAPECRDFLLLAFSLLLLDFPRAVTTQSALHLAA